MKIVDNSSMEGFLTVKRRFNTGEEEVLVDNEKNLITMASRRAHLAFLHDAAAPLDLITSFKVGNDGTIDPEGKRPRTPGVARTGLYGPISGVNSDIDIIVSDPADNTQAYITVVFSLNSDEANGESITECGLFKASGSMFNIKTFRSIPKTDAFSLIFEWTIKYV